mmetsp:Transcript_41300/g.62893  ORF Transcript_41300/g.62893 Transcript_41300/m.62893 type:complete len:253 (-) Transcript_41300:758-1516(-)
MAVVLSDKSLGGDLPGTALGELLGVGTLPDLDLVDIVVAEAGISHIVLERFAEVVLTLVAHEEVHLSAHDDFEVGDEVIGQVTATHVLFELGQDVSDGIGVDVLGGVDSETRESNSEKIGEVLSNSVSDVIRLGVQIREASKPTVVQEEGVGPRVQGTLAMEIGGDVLGSRELQAGLETSIVAVLVHEVLSEVWVVTRGALSAPVGATTAVTISMAVPDVVTSTGHVVNDGVGVNSDSGLSASLDHGLQLSS